MPNLIEVQKNSYQWFLDEGLKEVFDETGDTVEKTTFSICKITYAEESFIFDNNFIVNNIAVVPFIVVIK